MKPFNRNSCPLQQWRKESKLAARTIAKTGLLLSQERTWPGMALRACASHNYRNDNPCFTQGICWHQCIPEKPWCICKPFGSDKRVFPVSLLYIHTWKLPGLVSSGVTSEILTSPSCLKSSPKRNWPGSVCLTSWLFTYPQHKWKSIWTTHWGSRQHCLQLESTSETAGQAIQVLGSHTAPHIHRW